MKKATGFYPRVHVDAAGSGVVSQAGGVAVIETVRASGIDRTLSVALEAWRKPTAVHDPAKVVLDLAVTLALGGDCLADVAVLRAEPGVYGPVASDPDGLTHHRRPGRGRAAGVGRDQHRPRRGAGAGVGLGGPARPRCRHRRGPAADHRPGRDPGDLPQRQGIRSSHV